MLQFLQVTGWDLGGRLTTPMVKDEPTVARGDPCASVRGCCCRPRSRPASTVCWRVDPLTSHSGHLQVLAGTWNRLTGLMETGVEESRH
jgi:hypothetical protein